MLARGAGAVVAIMLVVGAPSVRAEGRTDVMMVIDFEDGAKPWPSIDDVVMGGVSSSEMVVEDGEATFRGEVSFDNNGGFASVRSLPQLRDLSAFDGLLLRVRGDGKRYGFRVRTSASFDNVSYQVDLQPSAGKWTDIRVPFADFIPVYRGREVSGHPPLDPSRVTTFGLIISRQEGPFRIDIASIRAVRNAARPATAD